MLLESHTILRLSFNSPLWVKHLLQTDPQRVNWVLTLSDSGGDLFNWKLVNIVFTCRIPISGLILYNFVDWACIKARKHIWYFSDIWSYFSCQVYLGKSKNDLDGPSPVKTFVSSFLARIRCMYTVSRTMLYFQKKRVELIEGCQNVKVFIAVKI